MPEAQHAYRTNPLAASGDGKLSAAASAAFLNLQSAFLNLQTPSGVDGAVRFNLMFSHLYPQLSPLERRRAEEFVDLLMAHLEKRGSAAQLAEAGGGCLSASGALASRSQQRFRPPIPDMR